MSPSIAFHLSPLGDRAVTVTLGDRIDEATHRLVRAAERSLRAAALPITDLVPAFASVSVFYDPARVPGNAALSPHDRMASAITALLGRVRVEEVPEPRVVEIPVCYGGAFGPDLDDVARQHALTSDEVIRIHAAGDYLVYMVGFMPGFAYLGGLSDRIATPRRASPRTAVPAGSVGIGGRQTGVYPLESPGGWNLIGRTPVEVFDANREQQTLLSTGDRVRFTPLTPSEYRRLVRHR